jgi:site-specific recombinase XerD
MLSGGISIAAISKILGHTSVQITQVYAKVTSQKVNEDMKILSERMKGRYIFPSIV